MYCGTVGRKMYYSTDDRDMSCIPVVRNVYSPVDRNVYSPVDRRDQPIREICTGQLM